jgi:hypothetical protein
MKSLTKKEAKNIAEKIKNVWLEKGYDVYTYIHKTTNHPKCPDWAVGSDLLNGLPRGNKK